MEGQIPHGSSLDRDRELEEKHLRERHLYRPRDEMYMPHEEMLRRERERDQRERERQHGEQYPVPHQNNTSSITLHQPVASRIPGAIHSPGGLLANHAEAASSAPIPGPNGHNASSFAGPLHQHHEANRSAASLNQQGAQLQATPGQPQPQLYGPGMVGHSQPGSSVPIGGPPGPATVYAGGAQIPPEVPQVRNVQQMPFAPQQQQPQQQPHQMTGPGALAAQGQQPILNDALSYLDQVKVQFVDHPDVYNRFLDIMKDFKSQAIDTPGVINRVSELFAGHPMLIQGFNTFLPPGYRIECGGSSDPNTIRVTTPMGTTVQSISGAGRALPDAPLQPAQQQQQGPNGAYYSQQRQGNWPQQQQNIEAAEPVYGQQAQNGAPPYAQSQAQSTYESQQAAAVHQQQQRGVNQLTSAMTAPAGHPPRTAVTPTPGAQGAAGTPSSAQQAGMEKRGPVEFNHAISYVNKIKNRFQDRPEIYKQFLEILQTYQRESKPIQDVYAQVTNLFSTAPDLLEDFKQFLPESAAQAKAAAKAAEDAATAASASMTPSQAQQLTRNNEPKMPPVGNFAPPPSASKDTKKRARPNQAPAVVQPSPTPDTGAQRGTSVVQTGNVAKRAKLNHPQSRPIPANEVLAVSPTLTPAIPEPMPPTTSSSATPDELAFFDRVKKYIGNKQTMNEFLKLCNLFSQDLIDRNVLVHKVSNFIGGNPDLMQWFKIFVNYEESDIIIENRPRAPTGKVSLSNCRGLGPSYRLLPKRERLRTCSGRDELCNSVLNDDWASHPTWASEDSGFVAHRKNIFEESLHRIEEERHDYDFNIETNSKVIQLLEPIAQQMLTLSPAELANFKIPVHLGGQSTSIYKRIFKKIYGPEHGPQVTQDLFRDPTAVLPVVLARLKQKDEEWRFTQREWEKVWRSQTQAMYLKSLDHQGISAKQSDKKLFNPKAIVDHMKTKYEEQRIQRGIKGRVPRHQYSYEYDDEDVIVDAIRFMVLYVMNASQHGSSERERISHFFETFVPLFFDVPATKVTERTQDISRNTPEDDGDELHSELPNGRSRRTNGNSKSTNLFRNVVDKGRNGTRARNQKEDSAASNSKESTPDVNSTGDDDVGEHPEDATAELSNERWLASTPGAGSSLTTKPLEQNELELKAEQPFRRDAYSLYCNQPILVFFSIFEVLYRRLKALKDSEEAVKHEVSRLKASKPAKEIGLIDSSAEILSLDGPSDTYYNKVLALIEDFILNEVEETKYQDFLRRYYLQKGWGVYTMPELLKSLCKMAAVCTSIDSKDKTSDILTQFMRQRESEETSYNNEINARRQTEKWVKDGELFAIRWYPQPRRVTFQWITHEETTFDLTDMQRKERWQYYVSSFIRIEPTEGVPRSRLRKTVLTRNLPSNDTASEEEGSLKRRPFMWDEQLSLRICVNTYRIMFKENTMEWFVYSDGTKSDADLDRARDNRNQRFRERFVMNSKWMENMSQSGVEKANEQFEKWVKGENIPGASSAVATTTEN